MLANKVHFSQWRDLIKGPEMRFHSAFDFELPAQQWTLVAMEKMRFPAELVLDFVEKQYVSVTDTNHQLLMQFALCESVRSAHRYLFSSLLKINQSGFSN
jgi:hypothetical protein